jgi:hypothetical protein
VVHHAGPADQRRWAQPSSVVKHAPKELVAGGLKGHNKPKTTKAMGEKKRAVSVREDQLVALLIQVIKRLAKYEPDALDLLDQITSTGEFNDSLDDIGGGE